MILLKSTAHVKVASFKIPKYINMKIMKYRKGAISRILSFFVILLFTVSLSFDQSDVSVLVLVD